MTTNPVGGVVSRTKRSFDLEPVYIRPERFRFGHNVITSRLSTVGV